MGSSYSTVTTSSSGPVCSTSSQGVSLGAHSPPVSHSSGLSVSADGSTYYSTPVHSHAESNLPQVTTCTSSSQNTPIDYSLPKFRCDPGTGMDCSDSTPLDLSCAHTPRDLTSFADSKANSTIIQLIVIPAPSSTNNRKAVCCAPRAVCKIAPAPTVDLSLEVENSRQVTEPERARSYACTYKYCLKTYLKSSHLKAHYRTHTG